MNPTTTHCIAASAATSRLISSSRPLLRTTYSALHSTFQPFHGASPWIRFIRSVATYPKASVRSYRFNAPPRPSCHPRSGYYGATLLAATAVGLLTPAGIEEQSKGVFEEASRSGGDGVETSEQRMLEASKREEEERRREYTDDSPWPKRLWGTAAVFYSDWIYEPIATTFRFLRLMVIFVPVLATIPVMFVGERVPEKSNERRGTLWWYVFLVNSMEKAGPTFIKLGQWAASRSDIFPTQMCELMSRLHSSVDPHPLSKTKRIVSAAFGGLPFEAIFVEFEEKPLGIGAIAQVYKAKLHPSLLSPSAEDNKEMKDFKETLRHNVEVLAKSSPRQVPSSSVAVKVLHPGVEEMVHRDLRIMHFFATMINAIPTMEWLSLPDEVDQFGQMMRLQLDLRIEGNNLARFRKNFRNRTTVTFPKPYLDWTTREVLIEEFAHGISLSAFLESGGGPFQKDIADMGLDAFLHMLLLDNFIHADLHPGNIMVRFYKPEKIDLLSLLSRPFNSKHPSPPPPTDTNDVTEAALRHLRPYLHDRESWNRELEKLADESYQPQLIFIDTGLVTELNAVNRANFLALFRAVAEFDGYRAGQLMIERCKQPDAVIGGEVFCLKMQHLILKVKSKTFALGQVKIGDLLSEVLTMVRQHHVRLEGEFANVVISILLLEGIGRALEPGLDLFKTALPMLRSLGAQSAMNQLHEERKARMGKKTDSGGMSWGDRMKAAWPMLKVWLALETRQFINTSVEEVEDCVKYDLISPNV
ncbi:ABC1-domain-containing protein [Terfezia boudieri ATCC MYA-4762]|uniref:ABC1-domain-containing protein n=1 Tax=Terfezia boudieri ATCC MYA-4762 TaxID=1051890 RepID=A0A3N4LKS6_9PEZI|nr:ABC1-domain-containing protein [Terfezia boudieri ATCC MYA-4762]